MTNIPRILVLSSAEPEYPDRMQLNDDFIAKLRGHLGDGISIEWHNYHDLRVEFESGKLTVYLRSQDIPLSDFDFVYIKSYFRYSEFAGVVVSYLDTVNTPFVCSELRNHIPLTKLTQLARLSLNNLPIAQTIFMLSTEFADSYDEIATKLGAPFIFKSIDGSGGDENYLIDNEEAFQDALKKFPDLKFIAQKFIQNDHDLRVLIVGGKIELVIKRQRKDESTHLNNTSQGADAFILPINELSEEDQGISLKSAAVMGREIAGVDLLFELGTGNPYILEVNASPQIASGAFTEEKLAIYSNYFKNMIKYES
jgi:glutathione synthase/RimK-type ligase-like ATP-grasp enzyme